MKVSAREDVAAPLDAVFAAVTDVAALERAALRRGLDVVRLDGDGPVAAGARWEVGFDFRGQRRQSVTEVTLCDPVHGLGFVTTSEGLRAEGLIDLTRLAKTRTRMVVSVEVRPETFRARLLIQSLKLAKSSLQERFRARISTFARQIEAGG